MYFDNKNFGLVDAAIAMEIAKRIDDGQPKAKLIDSVKRSFGIARHLLTALPNVATTIVGRRVRRDAADTTLQVKRQDFSQVSDT